MLKIHQKLKFILKLIVLFLLFNNIINGASGKLIELNDRNLDKIIKDNDRWVLQFYTKNCKLCFSFRPNLEKLSELPDSEYGTKINFGIVNADDNPHLVSRFMASRNPQYFFIDKKRVYTFTVIQTYSYFQEFLKYHRWKLFPVKEGHSDPFSYVAYFFGYFNVVGFLLKKHVFIYIPAKIFYSIIGLSMFSLLIWYAYRKHREFEEYIDNFEKNVEERYYNQCLKHGYDPFAMIEEMERQLKDKEDYKKIQKMEEKEIKEFLSIKGKLQKKND
eukprot:jgi/Orpsp1_1/1182924/evm.model.c7180000083176.1